MSVNTCPCVRCERGRFARWSGMLKAGRLVEVKAEVQENVKLRPEGSGIHADLATVLAHLDEGLIKTAVGELDNMVAVEEKSLELNPDEYDCLKEVTE